MKLLPLVAVVLVVIAAVGCNDPYGPQPYGPYQPQPQPYGPYPYPPQPYGPQPFIQPQPNPYCPPNSPNCPHNPRNPNQPYWNGWQIPVLGTDPPAYRRPF